MYEFFSKIYARIFSSDNTLLITFFVAATLLFFVSVLSFRLKNVSVFLSLLAVVVGGVLLTFAGVGISMQKTLPFWALLAVIVGIDYLLYFSLYSLYTRAKERRRAREIAARELRYTLPQKDNTFIRNRLNTVLSEEGESTLYADLDIRFAYANDLLAKLRSKTLSLTERLETEELAKVFALYAQKGACKGEDARLLGEAFSRVLKLAAKYEL